MTPPRPWRHQLARAEHRIGRRRQRQRTHRSHERRGRDASRERHLRLKVTGRSDTVARTIRAQLIERHLSERVMEKVTRRDRNPRSMALGPVGD